MRWLALSITVLAGVVLLVGWRATTHHSAHRCKRSPYYVPKSC